MLNKEMTAMEINWEERFRYWRERNMWL